MNKTDRVIQTKPLKREEPVDDDMDQEEDQEDEQPEETTALDEVADFDALTVWGHEALPHEKENPFARGVSEWIKFAEAVWIPSPLRSHPLSADPFQMHSYQPPTETGRSSNR